MVDDAISGAVKVRERLEQVLDQAWPDRESWGMDADAMPPPAA